MKLQKFIFSFIAACVLLPVVCQAHAGFHHLFLSHHGDISLWQDIDHLCTMVLMSLLAALAVVRVIGAMRPNSLLVTRITRGLAAAIVVTGVCLLFV